MVVALVVFAHAQVHSMKGFDAGKLSYLGLAQCPSVTSAGLSFLFRHSPAHMRRLDVAQTRALTSFSTSHLATYCHRVNR